MTVDPKAKQFVNNLTKSAEALCAFQHVGGAFYIVHCDESFQAAAEHFCQEWEKSSFESRFDGVRIVGGVTGIHERLPALVCFTVERLMRTENAFLEATHVPLDYLRALGFRF